MIEELEEEPGQWQEITPEQLDNLIILVEHGAELLDACFWLSIPWWEAMPLIKENVQIRKYVNCIKPLMRTFREAGMPIRQVVRTFNVSFRTASRAGLTDEQLERTRAKERENAAKRKEKFPELYEYQRKATAKWRKENYELELERNKIRRSKNPELAKQKARESTRKWRNKQKNEPIH